MHDGQGRDLRLWRRQHRGRWPDRRNERIAAVHLVLARDIQRTRRHTEDGADAVQHRKARAPQRSLRRHRRDHLLDHLRQRAEPSIDERKTRQLFAGRPQRAQHLAGAAVAVLEGVALQGGGLGRHVRKHTAHQPANLLLQVVGSNALVARGRDAHCIEAEADACAQVLLAVGTCADGGGPGRARRAVLIQDLLVVRQQVCQLRLGLTDGGMQPRCHLVGPQVGHGVARQEGRTEFPAVPVHGAAQAAKPGESLGVEDLLAAQGENLVLLQDDALGLLDVLGVGPFRAGNQPHVDREEHDLVELALQDLQ